jgi:hypothetical protein
MVRGAAIAAANLALVAGGTVGADAIGRDGGATRVERLAAALDLSAHGGYGTAGASAAPVAAAEPSASPEPSESPERTNPPDSLARSPAPAPEGGPAAKFEAGDLEADDDDHDDDDADDPDDGSGSGRTSDGGQEHD